MCTSTRQLEGKDDTLQAAIAAVLPLFAELLMLAHTAGSPNVPMQVSQGHPDWACGADQWAAQQDHLLLDLLSGR
jgi:hypothetical protein